MQKVRYHAREAERIKLLQSYSILDSLPEIEYDNLTKLAAEICKTPVSLISLVDDSRQLFKSHYGFELEETPREQSFCAHAINGDGSIFMIEDTRLDARFKDNPLVTGRPDIIFYAGVPLKNSLGLPLGTLCVIDHEPRILSKNQIEALNIISEQVMSLLELRKSKLELDNAHTELTKLSDKLEKMVSSRTKELESKNKELEAINAELQSFTYIASHDLQEPLRKIQIFISQLEENEFDNLTENGRYKFDRIRLAAFRMQNLIQDLLAYSVTENTGLKTEKVSLKSLVDETMDALKEELKKRGTTVVVSDNCNMDVVPSQFNQFFYNLFSNAIKFAKVDGPSSITLSGQTVEGHQYPDLPLKKNSRYTRILISDNGIGFEQCYSDKVFGIFQRLHNQAEFQGTGIGLAIVKKVILNHNGFIRVESSSGKGAQFEIFLPVKHFSESEQLNSLVIQSQD
tara:strand:- start:62 stop:1432 length:1371 start_codon:yes stop_codon:yes gene_type:complete